MFTIQTTGGVIKQTEPSVMSLVTKSSNDLAGQCREVEEAKCWLLKTMPSGDFQFYWYANKCCCCCCCCSSIVCSILMEFENIKMCYFLYFVKPVCPATKKVCYFLSVLTKNWIVTGDHKCWKGCAQKNLNCAARSGGDVVKMLKNVFSYHTLSVLQIFTLSWCAHLM